MSVLPWLSMRGRTFENAFVILDEAQNATTDQMKMFLTRMGKHCKLVVTGDLDQSDLPRGSGNGLGEAIDRLDGLRSEQGKVSVCYMSENDIVRCGLIAEILDAFRGDSMVCRY